MATARREGFVSYGGCRTWYRVVGDLGGANDPLLCLHGGPGSTHHYFAPLEQLAEHGRAVVVYDQLGCGQSDRPTDVDWSVALFRDELNALRDELDLTRVHLLGTSWGGMLALDHVLFGGGRVTSLILSSTLASIEEWTSEALRLRAELPRDVVATLDRLENAGMYSHPEYKAAEQVFMDRHFYRGPQPRPELEAMMRERGKEAYEAMVGPNEWTPTGKLRDWDVRGELHRIDVPTLVIRGRYDMCTPPIADTLVRGIRGARLVEFEDSSHTPVLEETDRYLEVVGDFLERADRLRHP